jgi:regulatory protein
VDDETDELIREQKAALLAALGTLSRRERTEAELRTWLRDRETPEDAVEYAIATLTETGDLNDERYAFTFADDKRDLAGWGRERIAATLSERGIASGLIERCCAEEHESQLDRAVEQLRRRGGDLSDDRGRARGLAFLSRRGYEYEIAYEAIRIAGGNSSAAA